MKFIFRTIAFPIIAILIFIVYTAFFDKILTVWDGVTVALIFTPLTIYGIYFYEKEIVRSPKPRYLRSGFHTFLLITLFLIIFPRNNGNPYAALAYAYGTSETTENKKEEKKLTKTEEYKQEFISSQKSMEQILRGKVYDKFEKESLQFYTKDYKINNIYTDAYHMGSALVYVDELNKDDAAYVYDKLIYVLQVKGELFGEPFNSDWYVAETDLLERDYKFWNKTYDENPMPSIIENNSDDDSYEHQTIYKY